MSSSIRQPEWTKIVSSSLNESMKQNKDTISYALSTFDVQTEVLRSRYVVHRGFLNERRSSENPKWSDNKTKGDDGQDLVNDDLVITTDVRSPKAKAISSNHSISLVWWHAPTQHQFRISALAYLIPSASQTSTPEIPSRLKPYPEFDWEEERRRHFWKLSPELRASFLRPIPGGPLVNEDPSQWKLELTDEEMYSQRELVKQAMENYALVVLEPYDIDIVNLKALPNTRQHFWRPTGQGFLGPEQWKKEDLIP